MLTRSEESLPLSFCLIPETHGEFITQQKLQHFSIYRLFPPPILASSEGYIPEGNRAILFAHYGEATNGYR